MDWTLQYKVPRPIWKAYFKVDPNLGPTSGPMDFILQGALYGPLCKVGLKLRPTSSPSGLDSKWTELQMSPNIKRPLGLVSV
jgi:hypothetical protein